uniref:Uncharacterized protein n=1 Tax=Arundo donax TaxID=35708 RepID=A0A0A9GLB3_ARUDO
MKGSLCIINKRETIRLNSNIITLI